MKEIEMKNKEWQQELREAITELDNVQTREQLLEVWKGRMAILGGDETTRDLLDKFDAKFGPLYAEIMAA